MNVHARAVGNKKARSKANGKGKRYVEPATTDLQLLQRLADNTVGSNADSMREDFIVAHFRTPCSLCPGYCNGVRRCHSFSTIRVTASIAQGSELRC